MFFSPPCWFLLKYVTGEKWREEKYGWQIEVVTQDSPCLPFPTGDSFSWLQLWQQKYPTSILHSSSPTDLDYVQIITLSPSNSRRRQPYLHFWVWIFIVVVQSLSCALFVTPWTVAHKASLSFIISRSSIKLMSIELIMPSNHLILCHLLLLLPSMCPSIRVFSSESALYIRWPKY